MQGYTRVALGRLELEQVKNIVREIKMLWRFLDNVRPNGDKKQLPDIQITKDSREQYYAHLNSQALSYLLLFCKNIPKPDYGKKDAVANLPTPPDFLRFD